MTTTGEQASQGAIGGASNEIGSAYRAGVAAQVIVAALTNGQVPEFLSARHEASFASDADSVPTHISLETDNPTDDINVTLADGSRILIQAKATGNFPVLKTVLTAQWIPSLVASHGVVPTGMVKKRMRNSFYLPSLPG